MLVLSLLELLSCRPDNNILDNFLWYLSRIFLEAFSIQRIRLIPNFRAIKDTKPCHITFKGSLVNLQFPRVPIFAAFSSMQYPAVLLVKLNKWTSLLLYVIAPSRPHIGALELYTKWPPTEKPKKIDNVPTLVETIVKTFSTFTLAKNWHCHHFYWSFDDVCFYRFL